PNTGKTTFFNAATLANAPVAGYPFTTIDANIGVTYVRNECPCRELDSSCNPKNSRCVKGTRYVPIRTIDVAGLVKGAYEGKGLGNQFLDNLRMASILIHLIDAAGATNAEGEPVSPGSHDPVDDVEFLENEIDHWINGILSEGWSRFARKSKLEGESMSKAISERLSGLGVNREQVSSALRTSDLDETSPEKWSEDDIFLLARSLRKISKPMMLAANKMDVPEAKENFERLLKLDYPVVPMSCEAELILRRASEKGFIDYQPGEGEFEIINEDKMNEKQKKALNSVRKLLQEWGSTGVQDAIDKAIYSLLEMIVVYPVDNENKLTDAKGNVLPDAILVSRGTTAREFAYEIHSDLGDSFIHAIDARSNRRIGENYKLKNGDIIKIVAAKGR
ncbi:translation-associated GTPase, partial [candidate division MSBL1 archaeon SCGC-AAA259A05]